MHLALMHRPVWKTWRRSKLVANTEISAPVNPQNIPAVGLANLLQWHSPACTRATKLASVYPVGNHDVLMQRPALWIHHKPPMISCHPEPSRCSSQHKQHPLESSFDSASLFLYLQCSWETASDKVNSFTALLMRKDNRQPHFQNPCGECSAEPS